jgi:hypothetical protein
MAARQGRQQPRSQLGETLLACGLGALVFTPVVYRIRTASAHTHVAFSLWPTWWMLVPLAVAIVGALLAFAPASFDLRRSLLHSRFVTRLRRRS